ncbi:MAG: bifunctional biotin--[acetyl-CoA-carboxylase] ligase/biotin operon repressor BirA [Methylococcaceae bacterium]|nr:bifunctional biotin--[acetyl-CoA-carboxylase] ligase/biotin operon repressor BirA [Methylococcaceae bacterium]
MTFTEKHYKILTILADGDFHSGTELSSALNISRAAIWKYLHSFADSGLEIIALSGKGYKLDRAIELLSDSQIKAELNQQTSALLSTLEIHSQIESTNSYLVECAKSESSLGRVCFAESQTGGRGRRGRQWVSPFGANIYLSLLWQFENGFSAISGLSLAVGVAVVRALSDMGVKNIGLKWPNDIFWQDKKLGGILIEVSGESGGDCSAVIGLGLNLYLPEKETSTITQPWTDLERIIGTHNYSRNQLASLLLNHLLPIVASFENDTFAAYLQEWRSYDCMQGKAVAIYIGQQQFDGVVAGIDDNGMLLLENKQGEIKTFASGEVSFRQS